MAVCKTIYHKRYTVTHCGVTLTEFIAPTAGTYTFTWNHLGALHQVSYTATEGEPLPVYGSWFNERSNVTGEWTDPSGNALSISEGDQTVEELFISVLYHTVNVSQSNPPTPGNLTEAIVSVNGSAEYTVGAGSYLINLLASSGTVGNTFQVGTTIGGNEIGDGEFGSEGWASIYAEWFFPSETTIYLTVDGSATFKLYFA